MIRYLDMMYGLRLVGMRLQPHPHKQKVILIILCVGIPRLSRTWLEPRPYSEISDVSPDP